MIESSGADTVQASVPGVTEVSPNSQEQNDVASGLGTERVSQPVGHPAAMPKPGPMQTLWILSEYIQTIAFFPIWPW
jgi:hypothetical protein